MSRVSTGSHMPGRPGLLGGGAGVVLGIAIGYGLFFPHEAEPAAPQPANPDVAARLSRLQSEHQALRADYQRLVAESDAERQRVRPVEIPADDAEPVAAETARAATGAAPLIDFGAWRDAPALRTADWSEMGLRARDLVESRGAGIGGGRPPELAALEKKALRELRAHLDGIRSFDPVLDGHPVVVVNLMASHLQRAGQPLLPWQVEAIEAEGRRYETESARLHRDLLSRDDALASEKKLRSIQLRKAVVDHIVERVLTGEQWDVLFDRETKGLLYYDVYQVGGLELERPNSSVYWRNVRADAEEHLRLFLLTEWELSREDIDRLAGTVRDWIDAILGLPRAPGHPTSALHVDEVLPCIEEHVAFQKRVLAELALDEEHVKGIRANPVYVVFPRLRNSR